jgi:hypothetical protein
MMAPMMMKRMRLVRRRGVLSTYEEEKNPYEEDEDISSDAKPDKELVDANEDGVSDAKMAETIEKDLDLGTHYCDQHRAVCIGQ